ncbi:DUF4004 family protein [Macrococcoides goetzii]|uniref:DUF4004 family protein n=2 Tax=Macrococcoides goetzii TaxID=1891097 RepID=A0A395GAH9_9STAP|nr:DUF4004 family protein [Macrococcus goetzii]
MLHCFRGDDMEDLISKKELLQVCDISYGQLYRWKRKKLIPEDWFIRKSTYTGQEAFFPRNKMIERIEMIKTLKDDHSLDDLYRMFEEDYELIDQEDYSSSLFAEPYWEIAESIFNKRNNVSHNEVMTLMFIELTLNSGYFSKEEVLESAQTYHHSEVKDVNYYFVRAMGVFILVCAKEIVNISENAKIIYELDDTKIQLAVKQKLKRGNHNDNEFKY